MNSLDVLKIIEEHGFFKATEGSWMGFDTNYRPRRAHKSGQCSHFASNPSSYFHDHIAWARGVYL